VEGLRLALSGVCVCLEVCVCSVKKEERHKILTKKSVSPRSCTHYAWPELSETDLNLTLSGRLL